MIHEILESGSKKANDPMSAVDYVLGLVDSKNEQRPHAPLVLGGSAHAFLSMAENVTKGRKYLSTTLSDESQADVSKVEYSSAIFRIHRLAGLPVENTAWIDVLHKKENSWDLHSLDALKLVGTHKKARFICGPKHYLRFQRLTCLLNFDFGWNDPLDPKTFRPARFVETWRVKPMWVVELDTSIKMAFQNGEIEGRSDLIELIHSFGCNTSVDDKQILISYQNDEWKLKGYAATKHGESAQQLARHKAQMTKPFVETRENPDRIRDLVRADFDKALIANFEYFGITPTVPPAGLIVPAREFYEENYIRGGRENHVRTDSKIVDGTIDTGRASGDKEPHSISISASGAHREHPTATGGYASGVVPVPTTDNDLGRLHGVSFNTNTNPLEDAREFERRHQDRVEKSRRELAETAERIAWWIRLILCLVKLPRWLRKYRAIEQAKRTRFADRHPIVWFPNQRKYIRKLRKKNLRPDVAYIPDTPPNSIDAKSRKPKIEYSEPDLN